MPRGQHGSTLRSQFLELFPPPLRFRSVAVLRVAREMALHSSFKTRRSSALGPDGCGIGYGVDTIASCTATTGGITNSLAVEFNTHYNGPGVDPSSDDVTIQNCSGTAQNSVDMGCSIALNDLTLMQNPINMADGNVHTVIINYSGASTKLLDVILDGTDLFPGGVVFDMTTIGLNSGNAWVGFHGGNGRSVQQPGHPELDVPAELSDCCHFHHNSNRAYLPERCRN